MRTACAAGMANARCFGALTIGTPWVSSQRETCQQRTLSPYAGASFPFALRSQSAVSSQEQRYQKTLIERPYVPWSTQSQRLRAAALSAIHMEFVKRYCGWSMRTCLLLRAAQGGCHLISSQLATSHLFTSPNWNHNSNLPYSDQQNPPHLQVQDVGIQVGGSRRAPPTPANPKTVPYPRSHRRSSIVMEPDMKGVKDFSPDPANRHWMPYPGIKWGEDVVPPPRPPQPRRSRHYSRKAPIQQT